MIMIALLLPDGVLAKGRCEEESAQGAAREVDVCPLPEVAVMSEIHEGGGPDMLVNEAQTGE